MAYQIATFKNVIEGIQAFCTSHTQINDFGWGDISNINPSEHNFPMIWLNPTDSSTNGPMTVYKFDMYVLDVLKQDRSNLLDLMNNTTIIGNDAISEFWIDESETLGFELNENGISMIPFEGRFDVFTGGWIFTIEIYVKTTLNKCIIPIS